MREMENYQQLILDNIVDTAWFIDTNGVFRAVNNAFLSFYNCRPDAVIGKTYNDLTDAETAATYIAQDQEVINSCSPKIIEYSYPASTNQPNSEQWAEIELTPALDSDGNCIGIVGLSRDITERKQHEQSLELADEIIDATTEAIMITDSDNNIVRVNRSFTYMTGYEANEVIGRNPSLLRSPRSTNLLYREMWTHLQEQGHWQGEIWDKRKDNTIYPKWISISTLKQAGSKKVLNYIALFTDITERKKIENHIKYIAYHDTLTGLANKAFLEKKLIAAIAEAEQESYYVGLVQIDLDNFKKVNESLGHYVGDEVLKTAAGIITSCLRSTDFVARIGGDEFTILLDNVKSAFDIKHLGQMILEKFAEPMKVMSYSLHITPSIGFCMYPQDGQNHEVLLQNADTAMYRAKQNGKNQCAFFDSSMTDELLKHVKIENQLRKAIKKHQFSLFYQPQIRLSDKCLVGVEALIRLNTRTESISPVEFIPVAEDTGLIIPIGEWVLRQACEDAVKWMRDNPSLKLTVAVNLSAHQFEYSYIIKLVKNTLLETGLPAELLVLEITESTVIKDINETIHVLSELKAMGINIALDDFGTGYSSLSYLKSFELDYIKIDRSFIRDIPHDKNDCSITQAIINMAKGLDLKVIAEGAETQEHINFLNELECEKVQGYFYAKPMSFDDFNHFLEGWENKNKN
jgi:diguanylate cyclase (GGDEF)-like protein/PAS domain S-box-containing protein